MTLVDKFKNVGKKVALGLAGLTVGAVALFSPVKANAGVIYLEISPDNPNNVVINQPTQGHVSLYTEDSSLTSKVQSINYDIFGSPSKIDQSNFIANVPSSNDIFYSFAMDPSYNQVDSTFNGGWLNDFNRRRVNSADGPKMNISVKTTDIDTRKYVETFTFTPIALDPVGTTKLSLSNYHVYPPESGEYAITPVNVQFKVLPESVPEPSTLLLLGTAALFGAGIYERRKMNEKKAE